MEAPHGCVLRRDLNHSTEMSTQYDSLVSLIAEKAKDGHGPVTVLIRGPQGAGKSTLAKRLTRDLTDNLNLPAVWLENDSYFYNEEGVYAWSQDKVPSAIAKVEAEYFRAMAQPFTKVVLVSNVFRTHRCMRTYRDCARENKSPIVIIRLTNVHKNNHNVPYDIVSKTARTMMPLSGELTFDEDL